MDCRIVYVNKTVHRFVEFNVRYTFNKDVTYRITFRVVTASNGCSFHYEVYSLFEFFHICFLSGVE